MTKALLVVDYSNDFIADAGAMSCGAAGQALDAPILAQVRAVLDEGGFVFICNDAHRAGDPYDAERSLFPPHNIVNTWGAEIFGATGAELRALLAEQHPLVEYLPKLHYSAFAGTALHDLLRARQADQLIVVGVCTDICVLHTVIDAFYHGYRITVPADCCATVFEHGQEWALQHMKSCLAVDVQ